MWMIRGSPRTPDRLSELSGSHVQQSEVLRTMTGACELCNLGGSVIVTHNNSSRRCPRRCQRVCSGAWGGPHRARTVHRPPSMAGE
jgi:hypothetical protein